MLAGKSLTSSRSARGASVVLVALGALLIVLGIVAAFQMTIFLGGSRELRNAVDAAALNVSKRVVELKTVPDPVYEDCADSTGQVGITNINRIWGKAYLINANFDEMQQESTKTDVSTNCAQLAYQKAQAINDALFTAVNNKANADGYFNQMAGSKPARLLGNDGTVSTSQNSDWATAAIYRGDESNISFNPSQLPQGAQLEGVQRNGRNYVTGYAPFKANQQYFCFTTFHAFEMPHLVSSLFFNAGKAPIANATNPIPNAFMEGGQSNSATAGLSASACAVANPMRQFQLAIPHSFVTVQIGNNARWYVQNNLVNQTPYDFSAETQWGVKNYQLKAPAQGTLDGYASLGNEYKSVSNLWQAINALPGDHQTPLFRLLQRVQEFKPNYTMAQLTQLLQSQSLMPNINLNKFYIYPTYTTPDLSDPTVRIISSSAELPPWLQPNAPDGLEKSVSQEPPQRDQPNFCWDQIVGGVAPTGQHWTEVSGNIYWQPGTGYGQCLGELRMARLTEIFFTGMP